MVQLITLVCVERALLPTCMQFPKTSGQECPLHVSKYAKKFRLSHYQLFRRDRFQIPVIEIHSLVVGLDTEALVAAVGADVVAVNGNA